MSLYLLQYLNSWIMCCCQEGNHTLIVWFAPFFPLSLHFCTERLHAITSHHAPCVLLSIIKFHIEVYHTHSNQCTGFQHNCSGQWVTGIAGSFCVVSVVRGRRRWEGAQTGREVGMLKSCHRQKASGVMGRVWVSVRRRIGPIDAERSLPLPILMGQNKHKWNVKGRIFVYPCLWFQHTIC